MPLLLSLLLSLLLVLLLPLGARAQATASPEWAAVEAETLRHFQALVRRDTSDPPGREQEAVDYLRGVLEADGIPVQTYVLESGRPNLVARLTGRGPGRPLLLMAHTDVVNVDPARWSHPPFGAVREGGYVYGRGTLDDKDNLASALMVMLLLKRLNVPLARDVILLAEAGEEGTTRVGIQFMTEQHFPAIDAEYCLAEGGRVERRDGQARFAAVQTLEKIPRAVEVTARGVAGHASVPLQSNAVVRLGTALARIADWQPPIRLNETTGTYFRRLAQIASPEAARRYADVLDPAKVQAVEQEFRATEPAHAAILHATASPTMVDAGYRLNVIPSEAKASIDLRLLPDDDPEAILESLRAAIADPAVSVDWAPRDVRPGGTSRLDTRAFEAIEAAVRRHYDVPTLPTMSTGATDMAYLRARGVQCYGIGPGIDVEDGPLGFGAHSDQERILEGELHRFVRFTWDVVTQLVATP